jgi:hypothetical protein
MGVSKGGERFFSPHRVPPCGPEPPGGGQRFGGAVGSFRMGCLQTHSKFKQRICRGYPLLAGRDGPGKTVPFLQLFP